MKALIKSFRFTLRDLIGITAFVGITLGAATINAVDNKGDLAFNLYRAAVAASVIISLAIAMSSPPNTRNLYWAYSLGAIAYGVMGPTSWFYDLLDYLPLDFTPNSPSDKLNQFQFAEKAITVAAGYFCSKLVQARSLMFTSQYSDTGDSCGGA